MLVACFSGDTLRSFHFLINTLSKLRIGVSEEAPGVSSYSAIAAKSPETISIFFLCIQILKDNERKDSPVFLPINSKEPIEDGEFLLLTK